MKAMGSNVGSIHAPDDRRNMRTVFVADPRPPPPLDAAALFVATYATFAAVCRDIAEPGVAIIAIDERGRRVAGLTMLHASGGRHAAAIVGRHDACDLVLTASDELPLRQLAVILDPVTTGTAGRADLQYRILDLRTERGFLDERGRVLRGLRGDGPAVLRCAGHVLYVLPLGDPGDWPESGADAWARQPERVYFDELVHPARGSSTLVPNFRAGSVRRTQITSIRGPHESSRILVVDDDLAGTLEIIGPDRSTVIRVGQTALRDGVLVGRYPRCDSASVVDDKVSRVHALLIQLGDELLVIDTASTNGTRCGDGGPARLHRLDGASELTFGEGTRGCWRWVS